MESKLGQNKRKTKLAATRNAIEILMIGISITDKKRNYWTRERTKVPDVANRVMQLKKFRR